MIPIKKINGIQLKRVEMKKGRAPKFGGESSLPSIGFEYMRGSLWNISTFEIS
jgi:hypothetical protein